MTGRPVTCCFTGHRPANLPWGTEEADALLIAVHNGLPGGTRSTVEYAMRRGVSIVDIPLET